MPVAADCDNFGYILSLLSLISNCSTGAYIVLYTLMWEPTEGITVKETKIQNTYLNTSYMLRTISLCRHP
jgi:hypothetical protein